MGAAFATLGICLPSLVIIFAISLFFDAFLSQAYVRYAFRGIQVAVVYLILSTGLKMFKNIKKTPFNVTAICVTLVGMIGTSVFAVRFSSVFYILVSGFVGLVLYFLRRVGKEKSK